MQCMVSFFRRYLWDPLFKISVDMVVLTTSNQRIFSRNGFILKKSLRGFAKAFCFGSIKLVETWATYFEAKEYNYKKILPLRQIAAITGNTWNLFWKRIFPHRHWRIFYARSPKFPGVLLFRNIYKGWICPQFLWSKVLSSEMDPAEIRFIR